MNLQVQILTQDKDSCDPRVVLELVGPGLPAWKLKLKPKRYPG